MATFLAQGRYGVGITQRVPEKKLPSSVEIRRRLVEPDKCDLSIRRQCELLGSQPGWDDSLFLSVHGRVTQTLATQLGAELFLISTGVEQVALRYGQPNQENLSTIRVSETKCYMAEGHFAAGSMKPKIEACLTFLERSSHQGSIAIITDPPNLEAVLAGTTGTRIVRDV